MRLVTVRVCYHGEQIYLVTGYKKLAGRVTKVGRVEEGFLDKPAPLDYMTDMEPSVELPVVARTLPRVSSGS